MASSERNVWDNRVHAGKFVDCNTLGARDFAERVSEVLPLGWGCFRLDLGLGLGYIAQQIGYIGGGGIIT